MIIYKCLLTGDEMFSDSFKLKLVDDFFYEIDAKKIKESTGVDASLLGANQSADAADEGVADGEITEFDIVLSHKLKLTTFPNKKSYAVYIKDYMKAVKEKLKDQPDKVADFEERAKKCVPALMGQFKDLDFYQGESESGTGMIALLNYREDGITPYFIFFKDGLLSEKY